MLGTEETELVIIVSSLFFLSFLLCIQSAIHTTRIPVVEVTGDGVIDPLDFEVSDNPHHVRCLSFFYVLVKKVELHTLPCLLNMSTHKRIYYRSLAIQCLVFLFDWYFLPCLVQTRSLDTSHFPVIVTLSMIGSHVVVDASSEEEGCMRGRVVVAITPRGNICTVNKGGQGGLFPAMLMDMFKLARQTGKMLDDALVASLHREQQLGDRPSVGLLA